mgnify:FL=1
MSPERLTLWIALLPLLAAALPLLEKAFGRPRTEAGPASDLGALLGLAGPLAVLALLYPAVTDGGIVHLTLGEWSPSIGIRYRLDGPAWFASAFTAVVSLCAGLYARARGGYSPTFWFLFLLCHWSLQSALLAADFFHLFVCLELMALTSYVLIAYKKESAALFASFNYLTVSTAAIVFYLFGLYLLYGAAGTLSIEETGRVLASAGPRERSHAALGLAFLAGGLGVRTAFLPFHGWLPDAHASAPHPVSALLSGAMIKVSFFAQWRILSLAEFPMLRESFLWLGAAGACAGVVLALCQSNAKRLLAWHSVSQVGYVLAAFGAGSPAGLLAAGLHAAAHGLFKSLLFLSVGSAADAAGCRDAYRMAGAFRGLPEAGAGFVVGALSIAALPPFIGAVSKDLVAYAAGGGLPGTLLLAASVGTAASFSKLGILLFSAPEPGSRTPALSAVELGRLRAALRRGALPLAALCLGTGLAAPALVPVAAGLLAPGYTAAFAFSLSGAAKSLGIATAGFAAARAVLSPRGRALAHRFERLGTGSETTLTLTLLGLALLAALGGWAGRGIPG